MDPIPQTLNLPELLLGSGSLHGYSLRYLPRGFIGQGVFFLLWLLFARAPRHWFLEFFLLSAPGVQSVIFCCAPLGAATFRRGQSKKKHHPGCFFLLRPRGKAGEGEAPCRHGSRAKKNTTQGVFFFFGSGPGERQGKEKPHWAPARGQSKKKTPGLSPGPQQKKQNTLWVVFFFLLWPRAGAQRGFSFPCLSPGPEVFFFCSGPVPARGFSFSCLSPGPEQKEHPGWCFFFLLWPRADAHSLTAGLGGDASPSPGWCVFFFAAAPPGPGWCFFFFCCGPARTLTLGRFRQGPGGVFFFFLLRPRRVFLDNNKKCLGYYIESKKTRRGHSKKKKKTLPGFIYTTKTELGPPKP